MIPPIFQLAFASAEVKAAFGSNPLRVYPFGSAPQGVAKPYAVWRLYAGSPENYLGNLPDMDRYVLQVDVYDSTPPAVISAARKLRDALEPHAHILAYRAGDTDPETGDARYSFDIEFFTSR